MSQKIKIRLFVATPLIEQTSVSLDEAPSHYLIHVMKAKIGDPLLLFNAECGEFLAVIETISKKNVSVSLERQTRQPLSSPDVWLLFAPLKKDQTDFVIQKATELGCAKIVPVLTKFTITEKTRIERFKAQAIEAAEQSRRLDVPSIDDAVPLTKVLANWNKQRPLYFMDESGNGHDVFSIFGAARIAKENKAALLIGPEGGFSDDELALLRSLPFARGVSLGPRILRAETAVAAALSCWQALVGDWTSAHDESL